MKKFKSLTLLFALCIGALSSVAFVAQSNENARCRRPNVDCVFERVLEFTEAEYGITELPTLAPPLANYVNGVQAGKLVYVASAGPQILTEGGGFMKGQLPTMTLAEAQEAAVLSCIRGLRFLKSVVGDLDDVKRVVMVTGNVKVTPDYDDVLSGPVAGAIGSTIDGCSNFLVTVFGEDIGKHARAVGGSTALPFNIATEIEIIVEMK